MFAIRVKDFFRLEDAAAVDAAVTFGKPQQLDAFYGDGLLKWSLTNQLFKFQQDSEADPGKLSQKRARYESNAVMAVFLRESDLFEIAPNAKTVGDHTLGTIFESLLWKCYLRDSALAETVVDEYTAWVDEFLDPSVVVETTVSTTCWQLPSGPLEVHTSNSVELDTKAGETLAECLHAMTVRKRQQKVCAENAVKLREETIRRLKEIALLGVCEANEGIGHTWSGNRLANRNDSIILGRQSDITWHGLMCCSCSAISIYRKENKNNKNSGRYFLLGPETCPKSGPSSWLARYNADLKEILESAQQPGYRVTADHLRNFGFLGA